MENDEFNNIQQMIFDQLKDLKKDSRSSNDKLVELTTTVKIYMGNTNDKFTAFEKDLDKHASKVELLEGKVEGLGKFTMSDVFKFATGIVAIIALVIVLSPLFDVISKN